ncbi:MAG: hypothetical protein JXB05_20920 [Myxococcaceae bacterium]|nr:hypothetical protein [Myxococcaceae bacterium]
MKKASFAVRRAHAVQPHANCRVLPCFTLVLWFGGAVACGPVGEPATHTQEHPGQQEAALADFESDLASTNGLSTNGLSTNGLSTNGLSTNGLSTNGLSALAFQNWFEAAPDERSTLMKYIVLCAVPAEQTRTYTSPVTGITYTWHGGLGLAPGWSTGLTPSLAEQQVVSACLAAHANKYGIHIFISVLGHSAQGVSIPYTSSELETYSEREACFFGNLFNDEGLFAANDRTFLHASESTTRACGLSSKVSSSECLPMLHVGSCKSFCTLDSSRTYYTQCTYNGVTYQPLTTRIRSTDIYSCGDGVCQFTESCGTGGTYDNCGVDCGSC